MRNQNFISTTQSRRFLRLIWVTAPFFALMSMTGALTGCGAAGGGSMNNPSASPTPPPASTISKIELKVHTDNAPADGEMVNVVVVIGKNASDEPVSGFTPALNLSTTVEANCFAANVQGEAVCFLKATSPGKVTVSVNNLVAASLSLSKSVTVTFKEKKEQRPGNQVGGSTSVSVGHADPSDPSSAVLASVTSVMGEFVTVPETDSATTAALKDASLPADDLSDPLSPRYYYRLISNLLGTVIWE